MTRPKIALASVVALLLVVAWYVTSWSTTQPGGSSDYDVAYDIWFNQTPTTSGQPNGTELMVWLNHNGSVQPIGTEVASNVTLGGHTYNIWEGAQSTWNTATYEMTSAATSVTDLDVGTLAQDMVSRAYTSKNWFLVDVEAGFELWQGGAGLETNSFSVDVDGNSGGTAPTSAPTTPATPPSSPASGTGACSAAYSVLSSWSGGFQGQVVVTNTGSAPLNGWQLGWTFPGSQAVTNLWNGADTQSGDKVTVTILAATPHPLACHAPEVVGRGDRGYHRGDRRPHCRMAPPGPRPASPRSRRTA